MISSNSIKFIGINLTWMCKTYALKTTKESSEKSKKASKNRKINHVHGSEGLPHSCWWRIGLQCRKSGFLGGKEPLEEEMATQPNILAWRIPWTEEPGGLQTQQSQVRHYLVTEPPPPSWIRLIMVMIFLQLIYRFSVISVRIEQPLL